MSRGTRVKAKGPFVAGFLVNGVVHSLLSFSFEVMQLSRGILTPALALASLLLTLSLPICKMEQSDTFSDVFKT